MCSGVLVEGKSGSVIEEAFTMYEMMRALSGVRKTSPGKDDICVELIKFLSETSLNSILGLFNRVWETGKLPSEWKHGVIVPIGKPGKDKASSTK